MRFDGKYGKPGHRRQLYRCLPGNGDRPHRFTEVLPREEAWLDSCEVCERAVGVHEGPHAARHYQFVARGIAEALHAVGAGATYRRAALVARERARRLRADPDSGDLRLTRHGQLVMDWVEVFAPVVFESHRPTAWPAVGSLLLDDLPFSVRDPATGRFRIAFKVFCAVGFEHDRPKLWRIEAFPEASQANWETFLGGLEDAPPRVVCDNHSGLNAAVRIAELSAGVEAAFTGPSFWKPFVRDARAADIARLSSWLDSTGRIVEDQFARRGLHGPRGPNTPLSTSPMDGLIHPIRDALRPRRYGLKNRERTNRLLLLMQLHANRQDDPRTYTTDIRAWLQANNGRPPAARRAITNPRDQPSLR